MITLSATRAAASCRSGPPDPAASIAFAQDEIVRHSDKKLARVHEREPAHHLNVRRRNAAMALADRGDEDGGDSLKHRWQDNSCRLTMRNASIPMSIVRASMQRSLLSVRSLL